MTDFVKNKHNSTIINLDNVCSIYPHVCKSKIIEFEYAICFMFDNMIIDEIREEYWRFKSEVDFNNALDNLKIREI